MILRHVTKAASPAEEALNHHLRKDTVAEEIKIHQMIPVVNLVVNTRCLIGKVILMLYFTQVSFLISFTSISMLVLSTYLQPEINGCLCLEQRGIIYVCLYFRMAELAEELDPPPFPEWSLIDYVQLLVVCSKIFVLLNEFRILSFTFSFNIIINLLRFK